MKKPAWVVQKERARKIEGQETHWLFGLHAVRDALMNPKRVKVALKVTPNARLKLEEAIAAAELNPEVCDPRRFDAPLDPQSVHQGAALEVRPLDWGPLSDHLVPMEGPRPVMVVLDRVSDPHNVGAILRSAEVFGAAAVIAIDRHSAPETGALAKTASGALERQPYLRVRNLGRALEELRSAGYVLLGLDGTGEDSLDTALAQHGPRPIALVLGAEGPGLRDKTKSICDALVRIPSLGEFGSLNVSNAAAVSLYAVRTK